MRIIGGKFRGKRISPPKSFRGRPTTDFGKEGLFNTLQNLVDFDALEALDLFAGTGSISYEFLSRGTENLTAVDKSPVHCNFINNNFKDLGFKRARAIKKDAFLFIQNSEMEFNLIFADPPFDHPEIKNLPDLILESGILMDGGIVIIEHPQEVSFDHHPRLFNSKRYGHVNFSFFE